LRHEERTDERMSIAKHDGVEIYYETFGSPDDPTLLMVNGMGSQCVNFEEAWCEMFVAAGFHAVRFDNRDVGFSTKFDAAPIDENGASYHLTDMAADAISVLDAIGIERAHIMGLSLGGMIVQTMTIEHAPRVITMTSVMSNTGEREYGQPTPEALAH